MDINTIDITTAKALAYDELAKIEQAQQNIRLLNERIVLLSKQLPMDEVVETPAVEVVEPEATPE